MTRDPRTRNVRGLDVVVEDGVAHLEGTVPTDVRDAAREVAERNARGTRVRDGLTSPRRRGRLRPSRA
jgi:hypothetical protein